MISSNEPFGPLRGIRSLVRPEAGGVLWLASSAVLGGTAVAYLVASGRWYLALGLLLVLPAFVVLHRYPLATLTVWLLVVPVVAVTDSASVRKVFWLAHRALPVATLAVILLASMSGFHRRRLARPGWPELMMAGYVVASLLSIAYTSQAPLATAYVLYDRVVIPMCLYLIVRLLQPGERDLQRLLPAVVFILLGQSLLGLLQWTTPEMLPSAWLGKLGARTTGSLRSPEVFGTTVLFCGMFILHSGLIGRRSGVSRVWAVLLFVASMFMVFLTFSRATWLAGLIALGGTLYLYRRFTNWLVAILVPVVALVLASGLLTQQIEFAQQRFWSEQSEESAFSRLPVAYAAVRMFRSEPVVGWGYETFDQYDRDFQSRVANLTYPEKDHASHNLYLTILAEQGFVGFILYLGPMLYWLVRTRPSLPRMPASGFGGRQFLGVLWLVIASHVVINNFYRMQISFGLGMWWLTLGLIGSLVDRYGVESRRAHGSGPDADLARGKASEGMHP